MHQRIENLKEMENWIEQFLNALNQKKGATILALSGDLGAGKTTFTQLVARQLGINESVTSPTFVIQKEYMVPDHHWIKRMIHIDAYRLDDKSDLEYLGWKEHIHNPENLIIIEWPEMVDGIDMPEVQTIELLINPDHTRNLRVQ